MGKNAKWYSGGFVLLTVARSRDGYQHPRVSVCKLHSGEGAPELTDHPTRNAETLIAFEFQQTLGEIENHSGPGEPWLQLEEGTRLATAAYGGHLDTTVRFEYGRISIDSIARKCADISRACERYTEALNVLGARATQCQATFMAQALRSQWKLPLVFVAYDFGENSIARLDVDPSYPTAHALKNERERRAAQGVTQ